MSSILETERLLLRELVPDDLEFVAAMLADTDVMRFYPKPLDRQEAEDWLDRQLGRYRRDGHGLWLVLEKTTGSPMGQVGLNTQQVEGAREPEVGYLLHRPFWGQGPGGVRFTSIATPCKSFGLAAPGLIRGKPADWVTPENGYLSRNVDHAELRMSCGFTVDGELWQPDPDRGVSLTAESVVHFVRA